MAKVNPFQNQPGLEVVHPDTGLQVSYPPQQWSYSAQAEESYKEAISQMSLTQADVSQASISTGKGDSPPPEKRTKKILLIAIGCIVIVVAVIVGAVVGTQKSRTSPSSIPSAIDSDRANSTSIISPAEITGSPTSVSPGLAPTAVSWGYPHLEIFALTSNISNSVYRKYRNMNATGDGEFIPSGDDMELVGGSVDTNSSPSIAITQRVGSHTGNQTKIFVNGQGNCFQKWHKNDQVWSPADTDQWYTRFQGYSVIGAIASVPYRHSVEFAQLLYLSEAETGGLAAYYSKWDPDADGNWPNPKSIPGPDLQDMKPSATAWNGDDSRVDVFVVSKADSHLLHTTWSEATGKWSEFEDLNGFVTTPPTAISRRPGAIDVFIRGGDAGLWHLSYNNTDSEWTGWTRLGNVRIQGRPEAISATSESIDVFAWGEDGSMLHKSLDSDTGRWTPEHDFEVLVDGATGKLSGPPAAVSDGPGSIHVFAYREQRELIWKKLKSGSVGQAGTNTSVLADIPYLT